MYLKKIQILRRVYISKAESFGRKHYSMACDEQNTKSEKELLTVNAAAKALGLRPVTIRAWLAQRRIAGHRIGRAWRIPQTEIVRILIESYQPAAPPRSLS